MHESQRALTTLEDSANRLAKQLRDTQTRIVFAESCTGGLVAASLAAIPGISAWLCGSAVTYRGATKIAWLDVNAEDVQRDSAVNEQVAEQMAQSVLANTPESTLALAITGHLGPDAPVELDGVVYVGIANRSGTAVVTRFELTSRDRAARQQEAATIVLDAATAWLAGK